MGGSPAGVRRRSIARQLTLVMSLTTAGVVILACAAFVALDTIAARRDLAREIDGLGAVAGGNSAAAIVFDDRAWAREVLSGLSGNPHVVAAALFSRDGAAVASWSRTPNPAAPVLGPDGVRVGATAMTLYRPIVLDGERVGTVFLVSDLAQLRQRLNRFLIAALFVLVGATAAAFAISARVQRLVSTPILGLAAAATRVAAERDYSTRVAVHGDDEVGTLTESFNHMLQQIEARDAARQRAEEALRATEEQFRQSQKMEAIGRLAGGVAHDFNNLLTAIRGYCELTVDDPALPPALRDNLSEVIDASDRASGLTNQLLAFSRKQMLTPCIVDLADVVRGMEKMLRRLIREDIELRFVVAPRLGKVRADRGQLEQVILNLAVNARDAMLDGGRLTIETQNVRIDADYAERHADVTSGSYVLLAVSDTGCGMDAETRARIFEPFFTTKEQGKGTGLGLSTVYGIVRQSGGFIWVYSEPGLGTTFKIYLAEVEDADVVAAPQEQTAGAPAGTETILLVEDNEQVRRFTALALERQGYRVLDAPGAVAACDLARDYTGDIDLMLTDVVMPTMNGREVYEKIRRLRPATKVVFMSGYTEIGIVQQGIVDDGIAFIQKPFTPAGMGRVIRRVLDTGVPPPETRP